MSDPRAFTFEWDYIRLIVQERGGQWEAFVYDQKDCLVLNRVTRLTEQGAKATAVGLALYHRFGPTQENDPEVVAKLLSWKPLVDC